MAATYCTVLARAKRWLGMSMLSYEGGEFGALYAIDMGGVGYLLRALVRMKYGHFLVVIGPLARGNGGNEDGECRSPISGICGSTVVLEGVEKTMHSLFRSRVLP